ncbi:MAG: 7-cyano-7-deazaguanine synthase QueC [Proteobacteria bacterium]|nr:MAG: 7-cyano-7-deazaguanine synthase QueC [Pseudomonadota bacterium]
MTSSLVLLSGGLDSAANLALAYEAGHTVTALQLFYGQKASESERRASQDLADYYGAYYQSLEIPWLKDLGSSALTHDENDVPLLKQDELDTMSTITASAKAVWVPNRNGIFIQVAAAYAESEKIDQILVGFNREEAATFPDNTVEFMEQSTRALAYSTATHVRVNSFTAEMNKSEMVAALTCLKRKPFPFSKVWSCYFSGDEICRECESCGRFLRALQSQGVAY